MNEYVTIIYFDVNRLTKIIYNMNVKVISCWNTLNKKKISLNFEQTIQLVKKLFYYCEQYTKGKLDESFINWQIDQLQ
jgi:hypothetical protein